MQPLLQAPPALRDLQNHVLPHLPSAHLPSLPSVETQQKQAPAPASNGSDTSTTTTAAGSPSIVSLPHLPSLPSVETQQKQNQAPPDSSGTGTSAAGSPSIASLPHLLSLPSVDTQEKQHQAPSASNGDVGSPSITSLPNLPSLPSAGQDLPTSHFPPPKTGSPPTIEPLPSLPPPPHRSFLPNLSSLTLILEGLDMAGKAAKIAKDPAKMLALPTQLLGRLEKFFTSQPLAVKLLLLSGLVLLSGLAGAIIVSTPVLIVLSLLLAPAFAAVAVATTGFVLALGFSAAMVFAAVWAYNYTTGRGLFRRCGSLTGRRWHWRRRRMT